jgi:hypothetical protein
VYILDNIVVLRHFLKTPTFTCFVLYTHIHLVFPIFSELFLMSFMSYMFMNGSIDVMKFGCSKRGAVIQMALIAIGLAAFLAITGIVVAPLPSTFMRLVPQERIAVPGTDFTLELQVESSIPVNVFAGELRFNSEIIRVKSIDYNTSIADLWAIKPWYSNGDGTLNFGGGSTHPGGFTGSGTLISITFETLREGEGIISIYDPKIQVVAPIDAIVTVENAQNNLIAEQPDEAQFKVARETPSTDLNNDGKQSIIDISIFMLHLAKNETRYDFNLDGSVNLIDLNILLSR